MKKSLLLSAAVALMLGQAASAQAETAYGLMSGWPTWSVCSYELGQGTATKLFEVSLNGANAGASVGDYYYAYGIQYGANQSEDQVLVSINMQDQELAVIKNYGDSYREGAFTVVDLAGHDNELYALVTNNYWSEDLDQMVYSTDIAKVNTTTGELETMGNLAAQAWGLTWMGDDCYVVTKSGLKGWSNLIDLQKVNADYSLTAVTNNTEVAVNEMEQMHAVAAGDGCVYFFSGSTPVKFDVATGAVSLLDDVTAYQSYTGTTFTPSTKTGKAGAGVEEAPVTRLLTCTSTYGDYMGMAKETDCTAQHLYYYDGNLKLVAEIETATELGKIDQITQHYSAHRYNEAGQLTAIDTYQYGQYDFGDRQMKPSAGGSTYSYDENGNLVEENLGYNIVRYTYDADGNVAKEERYNINSYNGQEKLGKTIVYSDYIAKGKPGKAISKHTDGQLTGEFYEQTYTYDEKARLVKTYRECNVDTIVKIGSFTTIELVSGTFMQEEHWTYEGDQLSLYEKFISQDEESGELIPYLKTVYTVKDENTIGRQSYTAFWMPGAETEWYKSGTYQEDTYTDFAGMTESTALQLVSAVCSDEAVNSATIEFTVPQMAMFNTNIAFNIFRNGELVTTVPLMECFEEDGRLKLNEENGNLTYTDRELQNGTYEYFVQTVLVSGGNEGEEPLDDDIDEGFGVEPMAYLPLCVSNIKSVAVETVLPAASGLKAIAAEKDQNDLYHVTVQFTLPKNAEAFGFISNELLVNNSQIADDLTHDSKQDKLVCVIGEETATVYILTRYKYGKAVSEKVVIDVNNLSEPTSIAELRNMLQGDLTIYDMSGRQVTAPAETLKGNYIVVSGKTAYKVVLK